MKRKWDNDYKWDLNKTEKAFDKKLKENGFSILGVRMYISKTEWKIEKDGVVMEYAIDKEATKSALVWKVFINYYNTCKEYHKVKAEYEKQNIKVGDIKRLPMNSGKGFFMVEVINLFTYEGVEYAEVRPTEFNSFTREVEVSRLL